MDGLRQSLRFRGRLSAVAESHVERLVIVVSVFAGIGLTGEMIVIHNVSRYCDDIYECVASNGVPPLVSRQMRVTVECTTPLNALSPSLSPPPSLYRSSL